MSPYFWLGVWFVGLAGSVAAHEAGHVLIGRRYGWNYAGFTMKLTGPKVLMGHSSPEREDWNLGRVALAGPLATLVACVVFIGLAYLPIEYAWIFGSLAAVSYAIFIFNLLPAPHHRRRPHPLCRDRMANELGPRSRRLVRGGGANRSLARAANASRKLEPSPTIILVRSSGAVAYRDAAELGRCFGPSGLRSGQLSERVVRAQWCRFHWFTRFRGLVSHDRLRPSSSPTKDQGANSGRHRVLVVVMPRTGRTLSSPRRQGAALNSPGDRIRCHSRIMGSGGEKSPSRG